MSADRWPTVLSVLEYPPSEHAGSTIIHRALFKDYPGRLVLLTSFFGLSVAPEGKAALRKRFAVSRAPWIFYGRRFVAKILMVADLLAVPLIALQGYALAKRHRADALFASTVGPDFLLAAGIIAKVTGLPLFLYVNDDVIENSRAYTPLHRWAAQRYIPRIYRRAAHIWAGSDPMAEDLRTAFGSRSSAGLYPIDLAPFRRARTAAARPEPAEAPVQLLYTGSITDAQLDAIHVLLEALTLPGGDRFALTLYTTASPDWLQLLGLTEGFTSASARLDEMPAVLATGDILYLPYSFLERKKRIVRTSFPTKVSEYAASGVPVLIHAPTESSVARFSRESGFGYLVDVPEPQAVLDALHRLADDITLRARLGQASGEAAQTRFDADIVVPQMWELFRGSPDGD